MKKVIAEVTYTAGNVHQYIAPIDFSDTFSTTNHVDSLEKIAHSIFNTPPLWVKVLFVIRNAAVSLVGLKTTLPKDHTPEFKVGGYIGFFKIYSIQETELVLGANDTHLDFRAMIYNTGSESYNIKCTTLVKYNNWFGKFYMTVIRPFHYLVVKGMVKNAYRA